MKTTNKLKLKSLPHEFGKGYTWHIIDEKGNIYNTFYNSKGKDSCRKSIALKIFADWKVKK